mgnify:CR=1 FL=1
MSQQNQHKKEKQPVLATLKDKKLRLQGENSSFEANIKEKEDEKNAMKRKGDSLFNNFKVHQSTVDRISHGLVEDENFIKES